VCGSGDGKKLEKCREYFFFGHDKVHIYTHTLQYQCNLSLNCNNIRKELVMIATHYEDEITASQSAKSIKIGNIDSNY